MSQQSTGEEVLEDMRVVTNKTYRDAINSLNTLQSNFSFTETMKNLGNINRSELSIKEIREYARRIGYKSSDFNKLNIIHVTGTKGKGSTCAFTESIIRQYNFKKIGLFTSPHLKTVCERVRINGNPINELKFTKYFFEVWDKLSHTKSSKIEFPSLQPCGIVKPMYFKYLTLLSFHIFMSEGVDAAIYEVGVGGQYDSTNIIDKPIVTGITNLGIDHTSILGNSIESIAWNKSGIFKKDVPAVVSRQIEYPEVMKLIEQRAKEIGVSGLKFIDSNLLPSNIKLGLAGDFQRQNAALAIELATVFLQKFGETDLPNNGTLPDKFLKGLETTKWDGRCQIINNKPKFENINWYIDGAHTLESISVSSKWFKNEVSRSKNLKVLLFNQQSRNNANELLTKLYTNIISSKLNFDYVIFTTNVTWSDGNYNSDLVSMNFSKEIVDKLAIQKALAKTWKNLDQKK